MIVKFLDHSQVLSMLPDRNPEMHKGSCGKVLMICGSEGFTGAPAFAAMGALRAGSGLVYLAVPRCIYEVEAVKLMEPVVIPLPDQNGTVSSDAIASIAGYISKVDAVLLGPGMGQSDGVYEIVSWVLQNYNGPIVLDADGINVLKNHRNVLRDRTSPTILTPHAGEFQRIGGAITADKINSAGKLANELGVIVLLKGHKTVITDGCVAYTNNTGNPGMAVGGSGDVLAGIIAALLGHGLQPLEAAACAAWLHGAAGDICSGEIGQYGMLPSDMLKVLPRLLK